MNRLLAIGLIVIGGTNLVNAKDKSFAEDVAFLKKHTDVIVLKGAGGTAVAVVPQYQGRVMTSAVDAKAGTGFGWLNYDHIASGKFVPHINVFGGEDRFWLGPEGGQFSIFFKDFSSFDLDHWPTPAPNATDNYQILKRTDSSITCGHNFELTNYSGSKFSVGVTRTISVLNWDEARQTFKLQDMSDVKCVGFETINRVENRGSSTWDEMSGMLSIWILGMFKPSDSTTVIVPFKTDADGTIVNDTYFGKVPADRLSVLKSHVLFKGDGKYRSKIGIPPARSKEVVGSYDSKSNTLTVVTYTLDKSATKYVNSMWELQEHPFGGDVVNSYNDGPSKPGAKPLGPFYELETSSHALNLQSGQSHTHISKTYHFTGSKDSLNKICKSVLGISLDEVQKGLK